MNSIRISGGNLKGKKVYLHRKSLSENVKYAPKKPKKPKAAYKN